MTYAKSGTGAEQILYIMHPEGLVAKESSAWVYKYFKTDHLGSTRALLAARGTNLTKEQSTDYYPFGLAHSTNNLHLNRYLFSGKEIQDVSLNGAILGLYDFHARYYNPMLGRWFNIDPALQLANPYLYCANNPICYVDPNGEFIFAALGIAALIKAICVGAAIGAATYTASVAMSDGGFKNWSWASFGINMGIGALGGAVGGWTSSISKALGALPGAGIGALSGGITGGGMGYLANGLNNLANGYSFGRNWKSALWTGAAGGAIAGALTGGIKGYKNASSQGANRWTGAKYENTKRFSAPLKQGVSMQTDPTKDCYSYVDQYADAGHGNYDSETFWKVNNMESGGDPGMLMEDLYGDDLKIYNKYKMSKSDWHSLGLSIESNPMIEVMGVSNGHAVNITGVTIAEKLKIFGGGAKLVIRSVANWDPLIGHTANGFSKYSKITIIKY